MKTPPTVRLAGFSFGQKLVGQGNRTFCIGMLLLETSAGNAELRTKLEQLSADGVVFAACENTMRRKQLERKDLVELATTVPSGVSEVVRKQAAGYAYIKSGE